MRTPFMDAVRDYAWHSKTEGHVPRLTLGPDAMRALERELAEAKVLMKRVERPSSRIEPQRTLFGIEILEAAPEEPTARKPLCLPSLNDILMEILR